MQTRYFVRFIFHQVIFMGAFLNFSIFSIEHHPIELEAAKQILPGLYVASRNVDGEKLYFGLQENINNSIDAFRKFSINCAGRGSPPNPPPWCKKETQFGRNLEKRDLAKLYAGILLFVRDGKSPYGFDETRKLFDHDPLENKELVEYVCGTDKQNLEKFGHIGRIQSGASHVHRWGQDMFAWISTQPITNYRDFGYLGESHDYPEPFDLNESYKSNRDLVILISASLHNMDEKSPEETDVNISGSYETQHISHEKKYINVIGVYKPPHEILYGEHKDIALMFHGFLAHAARTLFGKDIYYIKDLADKMHQFLLDAIYTGKGYRGVILSSAEHYGDIDGKTPGSESHMNFSASTMAVERFFTEALNYAK